MAGKHGFGAYFKAHNGTALTKISNVLAVKPPNTTVETIDVTDHDSANAMREFIAGLIDTGEGTIRIHYLPGSAGDLLMTTLVTSRAVKAWSIGVPSSAGFWEFTGSAVFTSYEKDDVVIDDKMTALLSFKVSGPITEAAAA